MNELIKGKYGLLTKLGILLGIFLALSIFVKLLVAFIFVLILGVVLFILEKAKGRKLEKENTEGEEEGQENGRGRAPQSQQSRTMPEFSHYSTKRDTAEDQSSNTQEEAAPSGPEPSLFVQKVWHEKYEPLPEEEEPVIPQLEPSDFVKRVWQQADNAQTTQGSEESSGTPSIFEVKSETLEPVLEVTNPKKRVTNVAKKKAGKFVMKASTEAAIKAHAQPLPKKDIRKAQNKKTKTKLILKNKVVPSKKQKVAKTKKTNSKTQEVRIRTSKLPKGAILVIKKAKSKGKKDAAVTKFTKRKTL